MEQLQKCCRLGTVSHIVARKCRVRTGHIDAPLIDEIDFRNIVVIEHIRQLSIIYALTIPFTAVAFRRNALRYVMSRSGDPWNVLPDKYSDGGVKIVYPASRAVSTV